LQVLSLLMPIVTIFFEFIQPLQPQKFTPRTQGTGGSCTLLGSYVASTHTYTAETHSFTVETHSYVASSDSHNVGGDDTDVGEIALGVAALGAAGSALGKDTTAETDLMTLTSTPTNANNIVTSMCSVYVRNGTAANRTITIRLKHGTTVLSSEANVLNVSSVQVTLIAQETDVAASAQTYTTTIQSDATPVDLKTVGGMGAGVAILTGAYTPETHSYVASVHSYVASSDAYTASSDNHSCA